MLMTPASVRIYLYEAPVDMRCGFDALFALVGKAGFDVFAGHLFVFVSKRRDRVKILTWERGGLALWYKRLESGTFRVLEPRGKSTVLLDPGQLAMLLEGIDATKVRRSPRWSPRTEPA